MRQQQLQSFSICKSILMVVKMRYLEIRRQCLLHISFHQDSTGCSFIRSRGRLFLQRKYQQNSARFCKMKLRCFEKIVRENWRTWLGYKTNRQKVVSRVLAGYTFYLENGLRGSFYKLWSWKMTCGLLPRKKSGGFLGAVYTWLKNVVLIFNHISWNIFEQK